MTRKKQISNWYVVRKSFNRPSYSYYFYGTLQEALDWFSAWFNCSKHVMYCLSSKGEFSEVKLGVLRK